MGAVTNQLGKMKVAFVAVIFSSLALAQDCPVVTPIVCGPDDMTCGGGVDAAGCQMPDICIPMTGPIGNDGNACPSACPPICAVGDMVCPGGIDHNGCQMPDTCAPGATAECPATCPVHCPADHMHCGGGMDMNGCKMPDTCIPMTGPIGND